MSRKEELKKLLKHNSTFNVLSKINDPNDLLLLLEIAVEEKNYSDLRDILHKFPKTHEYDDIKVKTFEAYISHLSEYAKAWIIICIQNDNTKIELFEKYIAEFTEKDYLCQIIASIKDDTLKAQYFRKYKQYFTGEAFSDYLRKIKNDELRLKEYYEFSQEYDELRIDWIASAFSTAEKRIAFFEEHIQYVKPSEISHFIGSYIRSDIKQAEMLEKYFDLIPKADISKCIFSIKDSQVCVDLLKKFTLRMNSETIVELLKKIEDKNIKLELLDIAINMLKGESLAKVINTFDNYQDKKKILNKYLDKIDGDCLTSVLVYVGEDNEKDFLDTFISYLSYGNALFIVYKMIYCEHKKTEPFILNYLEYFNPYCLFLILNDVIRYNYSNDNFKKIILFNKLIEKAPNKETLKKVYNSISLVDPTYFVYHIYLTSDLWSKEDQYLIQRLLKNNRYLFNTFILELLDIPEIKSNFEVLEKFSKYPKISQSITDLYKKNKKKALLLTKLLDYISKQDINYDLIAINIIEEIRKPLYNKLISNLDLDNIDENNIKTLIFILLKANNIYDIEIESEIIVPVQNYNDLVNYFSIYNKTIDNQFAQRTNLKELKNLIFNKHFGIDYEMAEKLTKQYSVSLDKLNESELDFIRKLKYVLELETEQEARDYYQTEKPAPLDYVFIDQQIKKVFNTHLSNSLLKVKDLKPEKTIEYNGKSIPVYTPPAEFNLLVNSLAAYNKASTSISNYNSFWNNNIETQNHGICCSLISNQQPCSTAPIKDVMIGFDGFSSNSIQIMSDTDIVSSNDDFVFRSVGESLFMLSDDLIDYTRHGHNELVLERKELRNIESHYPNIQPSYVIIYDTTPSNLVERSLKAADELNVPILFIDTKIIAKRESEIIDNLFNELTLTLEPDTFKKMLVRFNNNANSYQRFPDTLSKYFPLEKMNLYLDQYYYQMKNILETDYSQKENIIKCFEEIIKILEAEKAKEECIHKEYDQTYMIDLYKYIKIFKTCLELNKKTNKALL